ncbi:MAG: hypothetical protein QM731_07350 [Chitinophagaceae bacterium]
MRHIYRIVFLTWLSAICFTVQAQQVRTARPAPPGTWQLLGTTMIRYTADRDVIIITGANAFRKLRFRVYDAPIEMINMEVIYDNGAPDNIPVNYAFPRGGYSRDISLRGAVRGIRRVNFVYRTIPGHSFQRAKVALYGLK